MAISYKVRISNKQAFEDRVIYGGHKIAKTGDLNAMLWIRVDDAGLPVIIRSVSGGATQNVGTLGPGECVVLPLAGVTKILAELSAADGSDVQCECVVFV